MCGIIGVFNDENAKRIVSTGLSVMKNRGRDGSDCVSIGNNCIGHNLHAIVDLVKQPIEAEGNYLVANCEIYNWKILNDEHKLKAKNDAELIIRLINRFGIDKIKEILLMLDGVYAFCYYSPKSKKCVIARDLFGEKPFWYSHSNHFAFASEKKALLASEIFNAIELNPRKIIVYDITHNKINYIEREFLTIGKETEDKLDVIKKKIEKLIEHAISKRVPDKKIGLLFSGGIDSVYIAFVLKKLGVDFTCYTAALEEKGMSEAEDLKYARLAAESLGLKLKVKSIDLKQTEKYIRKIIPLIEQTNVVKVGVALPFYIACELAKKDKVKVIFSGLGSEELFAGYDRHLKSQDVNKECLSGLLQMYERDLYRDDVVTMANCIELRIPFLDLKLAEYALKIPAKYKIDNHTKKIILRMVASDIGIPSTFTSRPKKAAQYGSKFDRAIQRLAQKSGMEFKAEYLNSFSKSSNLNLGVMWSGGKDSCYAAFLMKKHNYNLKCLLTIKSKNKYSYMFHTPNIDLTSLQAEAMDVPILIRETEGDKEIELEDMKELFIEAKKKFNIDGIITGALFSNYQRDRIDKIADEAGLKIFSPLWHKDQEEEMRELIDSKFRFIFSSVAAEGLDESWLGREITPKDIDKLAAMHENTGINIAGEGGEFESFVLDCPLFSKKIIIKKANKMSEGRLNHQFNIIEAELMEKEIKQF